MLATFDAMIKRSPLLQVTCTTVVPILEKRTMILRVYGNDFQCACAFEIDLNVAYSLAQHLVDQGLKLSRLRNA